MAVSLKSLDQQVIVITGASSGIGLATARAAAKRGARLVLAARSGEVLERIVQQIRERGGQAVCVVADVGRREDVQRIADVAIDRFGGFDTWVNDAATAIYGRLEQVSEEDSRRLFDTNFWGVVAGSLVAAKHLRRRGGAIINLGSQLSDHALPVQGMYAASKHAVKGFTDALRMELGEDGAPVSVTLIKPAGINTPYPEHAKNYTGHAPTLPPPVYEPEEVAMAILHAAEHPKRDIFVGAASKVASVANRTVPGAMDLVGETLMTDLQLQDQSAPSTEGGLYKAVGEGRVHGSSYQGHVMKSSLYTRASLHPVMTAAMLGAAGVAAAMALMGRGNGPGNGSARRDIMPAERVEDRPLAPF